MIVNIVVAAIIVFIICIVDFSSFFLSREVEDLLYVEEELGAAPEENVETQQAQEDSVAESDESTKSENPVVESKKSKGKNSEYDQQVSSTVADFIEDVYKEV